MEAALDKIVRTELNDRTGSIPKNKNITKIFERLERTNQQIVQLHQQGRIAKRLTDFFTVSLQVQNGGRLFLSAKEVDDANYETYKNKCGRFDTLLTASLMALEDQKLNQLIREKRSLFEEKHALLSEVKLMTETVGRIHTRANMTIEEESKAEEKVVAHLMELAPLRADLEVFQSRCNELKTDDYILEAVQSFQQEIHSASKAIANKGRTAAKHLFNKANDIFHQFKSMPAKLAGIDRFIALKEDLNRYRDIFETVGDADRQQKVERFIQTIEQTIENLQIEVEKQKAHEQRITEKQQEEINDAYTRFVEIRNQYAEGQITTESQQKNIGEQLKKYRDVLIANGQRMTAREIERFMNAAGLGKASPPSDADADDFDYKKGFLVLLPITIILVFLLLALLIL